MLVLTRRTGEKIMVGKEIVVKILGLKGGQVRLGIEAPLEVVALSKNPLTAEAVKAAQQDAIAAAVHHENETGNTTAFAAAVKPTLTLISAKKNHSASTEPVDQRHE